jgi:hypothetical protein
MNCWSLMSSKEEKRHRIGRIRIKSITGTISLDWEVLLVVWKNMYNAKLAWVRLTVFRTGCIFIFFSLNSTRSAPFSSCHQHNLLTFLAGNQYRRYPLAKDQRKLTSTDLTSEDEYMQFTIVSNTCTVGLKIPYRIIMATGLPIPSYPR